MKVPQHVAIILDGNGRWAKKRFMPRNMGHVQGSKAVERICEEAYNLGDNTFHIAFEVDDYEKAHELHEKMGCICYENPEMGIYFINDPDGYWLEIIPVRG